MQSWIILLCLFHIKVGIARHVELQKYSSSINGSTTRVGIKNPYSTRHIEKHGIGKPIGTTE
jgi:hypothetical protein